MSKTTTPNIRPLERRDRVTVTNLFKKVLTETGKTEMFDIISSAATVEEGSQDEEALGASIVKIGIDILISSVDIIDGDVGAWFANLLNVSIEEFDKMPLTIELDIIDQLGASPEAGDFFTRCWQAAKTTQWYGMVSKKLKQKLNTTSKKQK